MSMIPFNKPCLTGKEAHYMYQAVYSGKLSGNGVFTKKCQEYLESRYGFKKALLVTSRDVCHAVQSATGRRGDYPFIYIRFNGTGIPP